MKILLMLTLITNLLYSAGGVIVFNDGTTIEGDIISVDASTIQITPMGLTFPEQIRMENVDSLKLYDGNILVANGKVMFYYQYGQLMEPNSDDSVNQLSYEEYDVEYVVIPNWSLNLYTGYPLLKASSFKEFDKSNFLFGLSVGSPYGIFAGDFFMNVIGEFVYYNFQQKNNLEGQSFGGPAFQIGLSPGLFIGQASISLTACTGIYQNDKGKMTSGFITGGSLDIPLGELLSDYLDMDSEDIPIEIRVTSRSNVISKDEGATGWLDAGISIGYEF